MLSTLLMLVGGVVVLALLVLGTLTAVMKSHRKLLQVCFAKAPTATTARLAGGTFKDRESRKAMALLQLVDSAKTKTEFLAMLKSQVTNMVATKRLDGTTANIFMLLVTEHGAGQYVDACERVLTKVYSLPELEALAAVYGVIEDFVERVKRVDVMTMNEASEIVSRLMTEATRNVPAHRGEDETRPCKADEIVFMPVDNNGAPPSATAGRSTL